MTLLSGSALDPKRFFSSGCPEPKASSFDLTIGKIFDSDGKEVVGAFKLEPNHMVQVVSNEVFSLGNDVTGHVTYKTTLTREGIWALTVGIVDPGWNDPISTTLLNFSKQNHIIRVGQPFLRVSFFEHAPTLDTTLRHGPEVQEYYDGVQQRAVSTFPATFLDTDEITRSAGANVLESIGKHALGWVAVIAIVFAIIQVLPPYIPPLLGFPSSSELSTRVELDKIKADLQILKDTLGSPKAAAQSEVTRAEFDQIKADLQVIKSGLKPQPQ